MINQVVCAQGGANTGIGDCFFDPKNFVRTFIVPANFKLTETQLLTPEATLTALQDAAKADLAANRIYPTPEIQGITDNSEDVVTQTLGYGSPFVVRDGKYAFQFQYTKGGLCISNALRKFNSNSVRLIIIDAEGYVIGTRVGNEIQGIPLDVFYARPMKPNDGSNIAVYSYQVTFNPVYLNEKVGFMKLSLADLLMIDGLQNINILKSSRAAAVLKVKTLAGCSQVNLYDTYATELADDALWVAKMNGKSVDIVSVATDPNIEGFTVTLDTTDPDYVAGAPVTLSLEVVSALEAAGIVGYESVPAVITL